MEAKSSLDTTMNLPVSALLCRLPRVQNTMDPRTKIQKICIGFMDEDSSSTFVTKICTERTKVFSSLKTCLQFRWDKRYLARTPEGK